MAEPGARRKLKRIREPGAVPQSESDARRLLEVLPWRIATYGRQLHPVRTRLVGVCNPTQSPRRDNEGLGFSTLASFDFLGTTHYWGKVLKCYWIVNRKSSKARLATAVATVRD